jgi:hypothetical protein
MRIQYLNHTRRLRVQYANSDNHTSSLNRATTPRFVKAQILPEQTLPESRFIQPCFRSVAFVPDDTDISGRIASRFQRDNRGVRVGRRVINRDNFLIRHAVSPLAIKLLFWRFTAVTWPYCSGRSPELFLGRPH